MSGSLISNVIEILESVYGVPQARIADPVDLLVLTILSQNTSDVNSSRAFEQLKSSFRDYEEMIDAPEERISAAIRPGGLAEIKASRIKSALQRLKRDFGSIDLSPLRKMDAEAARDYLRSIPGVGAKTAAVLMLFGFDMPAMPVDTHVYRVSKRIGLVPEDASIEEAQRVLEDITPVEKYLSLHINLIRHGRMVCKARKPLCDICEIKNICRHASSVLNPTSRR